MARVAVVTGGTRGIGEAISVALRDAGEIEADLAAVLARAGRTQQQDRTRRQICISFHCDPTAGIR